MPPVPHRRHVLYLNEWGACGNCWYIDVGGSHRVTSTAAGGVADADDRSLLTTNCLSSSSSSTLHQLQGLSCLDISVLILTYSWSVLWSFSQQVLKVPYIDIRLHHRRARIVKSYSPSGPVCTPIQYMVPWAPTSLHANRNLSPSVGSAICRAWQTDRWQHLWLSTRRGERAVRVQNLRQGCRENCPYFCRLLNCLYQSDC